MRHLEGQIFSESHWSVYIELMLCAEHCRWSDPEDSSMVWGGQDQVTDPSGSGTHSQVTCLLWTLISSEDS